MEGGRKRGLNPLTASFKGSWSFLGKVKLTRTIKDKDRSQSNPLTATCIYCLFYRDMKSNIDQAVLSARSITGTSEPEKLRQSDGQWRGPSGAPVSVLHVVTVLYTSTDSSYCTTIITSFTSTSSYERNHFSKHHLRSLSSTLFLYYLISVWIFTHF